MKFLLLIACLGGYAGNAFAETKSDTIIINVGAKKKVVIYGETKADLKALEKIDLNKALREMNKGLEEMPTKTKRMVVKDFNGNTYTADIPPTDLTKWKRFVGKTNINLHAGLLDMNYYDVRGFSGANSYKYETFMGGRNANNFGISVLHGNIRKFNNRLGFAFRKGLQYNFYRSEGSRPAAVTLLGGTSEAVKNLNWDNLVKGELVYADSKRNSMIQTYTMKDGTTLKSQALPSVHTFGVLSVELQPTFYFLDHKGKTNFSFSPGGFVGLKLHQIEKTTYLNLSTENNKSGYSTTKSNENFGNINAGIQLDFAYKVFHVFWRQNLFSTFGKTTAMIADPTTTNDYLRRGEGRIRFTTIGLRIGR